MKHGRMHEVEIGWIQSRPLRLDHSTRCNSSQGSAPFSGSSRATETLHAMWLSSWLDTSWPPLQAKAGARGSVPALRLQDLPLLLFCLLDLLIFARPVVVSAYHQSHEDSPPLQIAQWPAMGCLDYQFNQRSNAFRRHFFSSCLPVQGSGTDALTESLVRIAPP